jgi:hypothetical protein
MRAPNTAGMRSGTRPIGMYLRLQPSDIRRLEDTLA